ncbi:MAG TPA: Gfo/Idh/MocA family oxidoreductase [Candidatus Paceibacterota bacterium]|nr:Gfo/Idh/MocA family oxidoreductase [Candidatus Paceibacterota bacterium]
MNQKNLALVGAGYWGKNLARNFLALDVLRTICDPSQASLDVFGNDYVGVEKTTSFESVLADAAVTRVAIAAPAVFHYQLAKAALEAGKDVFVEKPICLDLGEARSLVKLAAAEHRVLMVGHLLQHHPLVQELHSILARGELGKLQYITSNRLNLGKIRREENALWSFAPHDISVILSLAGSQLPEMVRCMGGEYLNHGISDTTLTFLRFAGDIRAHVYVSWLNPFKEQKLTVVGSNGIAVFDDTRSWNEKLLLYRQPVTWTNGQIPTPSKAKAEPVLVPEAEPLRAECQHFLTCCQERRAPCTDGDEGIRVLQVLQAAQRSLEREGEAVRPDDRGPIVTDRNSRSSTSTATSPVPADYFVHSTAVVDDGAQIGKGTKIWHFSHIMKGARIGERCVFGQNVNVDGGTVIGNNVKVQNNVSIYTGVVVEDDVFLGPSCVLTNVSNPRSQVNRHSLYEKTHIRRGATIGANATIVCGVTIGRYAFIGAGATVTKDVPDYALVMGNPARRKGWMSRHGHVLKNGSPDGVMVCPESGFRYQEKENGVLCCLDLDEESPLPSDCSVGRISYAQLKRRAASLQPA